MSILAHQYAERDPAPPVLSVLSAAPHVIAGELVPTRTDRAELVPVAAACAELPAPSAVPSAVPYRTPRTRNRAVLPAVLTVLGIVDVAGLGTAGYLAGTARLGLEFLAALAFVVLVASAVLAIGTGRVHCPGCPR